MIEYNYEVIYQGDKLIADLGLEEQGKVQKFMANTILALSSPYVPLDIAHLYENPGALRDSGRVEGTDVVWGGGVQNVMYARYLYYHPEFNFQGSPFRGGYWVDRAMKNGGLDKITEGCQKLVNKYAERV